MTNEASTMVVVARAALEGALRAALPHVARKIPEDAPDNGAGLMRLAVVTRSSAWASPCAPSDSPSCPTKKTRKTNERRNTRHPRR